jgi:drug/metabolite transporter (DMT)-like permease
MTWAVFAFLTAFFESAKDVLGKRRLGDTDEYVVAWAWRFFALPFLLPILIFTGIPELGSGFWWALLAGGTLNVVTAVLYMKAIKMSDLSLAVPMIAFTPLFLLLTSPLLLGEFPGPAGAVGVLLIVSGSYLMKARELAHGILAPFRALLVERGPRLMMIVALIWSVTANIDKIGLENSSPLFWAVAINLFIAAAMCPLALWRLRRRDRFLPLHLKGLFAIGAAGGLTTVCQMTAISMALVPLVIAIKRTSTVMTVLWGHFLFREAGLKERFSGVVLMSLGVLLIAIG